MGNPKLQEELDDLRGKVQVKVPSVSKVMTWCQEYVKVEIRYFCETIKYELHYACMEQAIINVFCFRFSVTKFRTLIMTLRFPQEYPAKNLLVELTSKTLGHNLLSGLSTQCEDECKNNAGTIFKTYLFKTV